MRDKRIASIARNWMITCLGSGMVVVVVVGVIFLWQSLSMIECRQVVIHTEKLIASLVDLRATVKDAETGQRGFVITGKREYLDPYESAVRSIPEKLDTVERDLNDGDAERRLAAKLHLLVGEKLSELKTTVELRRSQGFDAAARVVKTDVGRKLMDEIRAAVRAALDIEQNRLSEASDQLNERTRRTAFLFVIMSVLAVLLFCLFGYFMRQYLTEKRLTTEALTEHKNRLEEFYAILAHELRSPVASISGCLSLISAGALGSLTERGEDLVRATISETDRMLRLISELLDLKKIEEGKFDLNLKTVEAQSLVLKTIDGLHGMASQAKVNVVEEKGAANVPVRCDEDRIIQVLTNLLSNAIKFSPSDAEVAIGVEACDSQVKFLVKDKGPGIPAEKQSKVFQKFQQLGSSGNHRGTGLGLAISKSIAEVHGGSIGFESTPGRGSTFWLSLPATPQQTTA